MTNKSLHYILEIKNLQFADVIILYTRAETVEQESQLQWRGSVSSARLRDPLSEPKCKVVIFTRRKNYMLHTYIYICIHYMRPPKSKATRHNIG